MLTAALLRPLISKNSQNFLAISISHLQQTQPLQRPQGFPCANPPLDIMLSGPSNKITFSNLNHSEVKAPFLCPNTRAQGTSHTWELGGAWSQGLVTCLSFSQGAGGPADSPKGSQERSMEQFSKATGRRRPSDWKKPSMNLKGVKSIARLLSVLHF